jgi:hypothetical protein
MSEEKLKIGQMALVALKKQNNAIEVFKKPSPIVKKKNNKVILTESRYLKVKFLIVFFFTKLIINFLLGTRKNHPA